MTGDWEVMAGVRRGDIPNPVKALYSSYTKWCEKHGVEPSEEKLWRHYMENVRGYKVEKHRERSCMMLSKWIVPKSTLYKIRRKPKHVCKYCGSKYSPRPIKSPVSK
jgi:hypothetical protein